MTAAGQPIDGAGRLTGAGIAAGTAGILGIPMATGGGMGMVLCSAGLFLWGLLLLPRHGRTLAALAGRRGPLALIATGLALSVWFAGSSLWSPVRQGEALQFVSWQLPVSLVAVWVLAGITAADRTASVRALVALVAGTAGVLSIEAVSHYAMMRLANPAQAVPELERTLGRGAVVLVVLSWPAILASVRLGLDRRVTAGLVVACALLSTRFGMDMNAVLFVIGGLAAGLTALAPRLALGLLAGGAASTVLAAPWLYARLGELIFAIWPHQNGPLSYERRAQMWDYAIQRIYEMPVRGWGLDASRAFDGRLVYRGFEWANIQLHPHSAPLQIWLELGAVGAVLTALLLAAGGWAAIRAFGSDRLAAAALAAALGSVLAAFAVSFGAWQPWLWAVLTLAVGWALALRRTEPRFLAPVFDGEDHPGACSGDGAPRHPPP